MTRGRQLCITVLPETMAICQLESDAPVPEWALQSNFLSVTRTSGELSIVCPEANVPERTKCERGWRCLRVEGPLDFSLIGILASLAAPLADAGIAIFVLSTYATDYLLIAEKDMERAVMVLAESGHKVESP